MASAYSFNRVVLKRLLLLMFSISIFLALVFGLISASIVLGRQLIVSENIVIDETNNLFFDQLQYVIITDDIISIKRKFCFSVTTGALLPVIFQSVSILAFIKTKTASNFNSNLSKSRSYQERNLYFSLTNTTRQIDLNLVKNHNVAKLYKLKELVLDNANTHVIDRCTEHVYSTDKNYTNYFKMMQNSFTYNVTSNDMNKSLNSQMARTNACNFIYLDYPSDTITIYLAAVKHFVYMFLFQRWLNIIVPIDVNYNFETVEYTHFRRSCETLGVIQINFTIEFAHVLNFKFFTPNTKQIVNAFVDLPCIINVQ